MFKDFIYLYEPRFGPKSGRIKSKKSLIIKFLIVYNFQSFSSLNKYYFLLFNSYTVFKI